MKVLTSGEMREVDQRTEALGIPGPILMENAGHRVVEFLTGHWPGLRTQRIVVLCGTGNNGGDGFVIARQLFTRFRPRSLHVVATDPEGGGLALRMLRAAGCPVHGSITQEMRGATLVVDALLGTGLQGAARGRALDWIREINTGFSHARVLAVDVPSGMNSDSATSAGEVARADACVTFTAPKLCHVLPPNCDSLGEWTVAAIGSPASLMEHVRLHVSEPADFAPLLAPRRRDSNKGDYGHVLVVGGAEGKSGAAEMTAIAALRTGAGLVTVAASAARLPVPELMTEKLPQSWGELELLAERKRVIAIGPGLGQRAWAVDLVRDCVANAKQAMVLDADALNVLAGHEWRAGDALRVLTPHPGEMSRLLNVSIESVQSARLEAAQRYSRDHGAVLVLKGDRSIVAFPDGRAWINPTGSPALAKGGTGDILTGMVAAMLAQYPDDSERAVIAAVYLHGLAGQLAGAQRSERSVLATEVLDYLPEAMRECARVSDGV